MDFTVGYFEATRRTYVVLKWLWDEFVNARARRLIAWLYSWNVLARLIGLAYPWLIGYGIDALLARNAYGCCVAVAGTLFSYVASALIERLRVRCTDRAVRMNLVTMERRVNEYFFEKELGLHSGENVLLSRANMEKGVNRFDPMQKMVLFDGVESFNTFFITLLILLYFDVVAGAIILFAVLANIVLSVAMNRYILRAMAPVDEEYRRLNRHRNERWMFVDRVKTNAQERREVTEMNTAFTRNAKNETSVWDPYNDGATIRLIINGIGVTLVALWAGYQVWEGQSTITRLVPAVTWAGMIGQQMRILSRIERELTWIMPSFESLIAALLIPTRLRQTPNAYPLDEGVGIRVEFDSVSFRYGQDSAADTLCNVVQNVSFTIEPGEKVALIGPSGAGKSTLVRLLLRNMDPDAGEIRINGRSLTETTQDSWMRALAYISQGTQVLSGSLRYNLLYGLTEEERAATTDDDIHQFLRDMNIDFGSRLSDGLDTEVGERGLKLSGGEAQRVMIAAAAIKRPRFMIIDEATSSLDAEAQSRVQEGIERVLGGKASALLIAHRLSTIRECDSIVVLRPLNEVRPGESQIEAIARSVEELQGVSPTFRRLAELEGVRIVA